jgi:MotA/TolQ/ExbB proton channel family
MTPAQIPVRPARFSTTVAAFVLGLPLAFAVLALIQFGPLKESGLERYIEHPVEVVEIVLFCCALGALAAKLYGYREERAACRQELLPLWDGTPVPITEAPRLRAELHANVGRLGKSWLPRRLDAILDFTSKRGTADGLDDQLRALADTDALALDNSYSLIRFITWAIPILGFLGTVLGITKAIANVRQEDMNLSSVTEGLSLAFDTTAVGLALTMLTMFISFVVERLEQTVLEQVDHFTDVQLAHRFERSGSDDSGFTVALRQNTQLLLTTTEQLVRQQAEIWADALAAAQRQWATAGQKHEQQLTAALEKAMDRTLAAHEARLTAMKEHFDKQSGALVGQLAGFADAVHNMGREHQQSLSRVVNAVAAQTDALARLQHDGKQLVQLQDLLHHNLAALHGSGDFEQAVQSLTAAIHLLTAKAASATAGPSPNRLGTKPGAAA